MKEEKLRDFDFNPVRAIAYTKKPAPHAVKKTAGGGNHPRRFDGDGGTIRRKELEGINNNFYMPRDVDRKEAVQIVIGAMERDKYASNTIRMAWRQLNDMMKFCSKSDKVNKKFIADITIDICRAPAWCKYHELTILETEFAANILF